LPFSKSPQLRAWLLALGGTLVILLWQWATVHANYGGNWTALFCTGALQRHPPLDTAEHVYFFANSPGFDGQFYHYMAHDPFFRSDLKNYVDDPRLRYRRILIPLLAYGAALGNQEWIDGAYEFIFLLSIGLGVYWSCRFAQSSELAAAWGLLFLAAPAIPIAADRLVIDGGLATLTAGFVCYSRAPSWKLFLVLTCAVLTRDTGLLLVIAYCAYLAWRREFRIAGIFLLTAAPAIAWYIYVQVKTTGKEYVTSLIPFASVVRALVHPSPYPPGTPFVAAVRAGDYFALAGMLLAFGFALAWFVREPRDPLRLAAILFAALGVVLQRADLWENVYNFGRLYAPLLVCLAAIAARVRNPWLLLPIAMMLPRIAIQLAPQALGIIHWLA
jgi:hypothetical protein